MCKYFIKKLKPQELGYRGGKAGGGGRYFYVSKEFARILPALSRTQLNDTILLPIIPSESSKSVYCAYVYHNDKFAREGGTRNEFRIYLNTKVDPESSYFAPEDYIILFRVNNKQIPTFKLVRIPPDNVAYGTLDAFVANNTKQNMLLIDHLPIEVDDSFDESQHPEIAPEAVNYLTSAVDGIVDVPEEPEEPSPQVEDARLIRSTSFRDLVLFFYEYRCAITNKAIMFRDLCNLEAAHIKPDCHVGPMHPTNGLALTRDLHWAFDKGFFTISDDDFTVKVHDKVLNDQILGDLHGKKIFLPKDTRARPSKEFIQHHNKHVFGLFLNSGSLRSM